ncbi:protein mono-ADP-ribosyltransferase PARP11 [Oryzias melastigma]|nr:protein mono-ADP-ribosyltransferase PARP11 [Oryzias melastigma]
MWRYEGVEHMDTSDTPWCWFYLADCGRWHQFEEDVDGFLSSQDLEKCYLRDPKGILRNFCQNTMIDFSAMLQTDLTTGMQRRIKRDHGIKRSCSCFSSAPVFWDRMDASTAYQLTPLSQVTAEYQTVADFVVQEGLLNKTIVGLYRIQNFDLWEIFCRKRKQLMRLHGVHKFPERRLFHGTDVKNVHNICKYNFDLHLAGQNGHAFGTGIYFARCASFADKYSPSCSDPVALFGGATLSGNYKIQFLARVLVGKSQVGQPNFKKPDHGKAENKHNSCVDDVKHPKIFVIFDPNQIYPEYLIQYQ